jgi:preprotein translocase subunit SecE
VKQWRSTLWVVGFLSVVLVFLGIIGGRNTAAL